MECFYYEFFAASQSLTLSKLRKLGVFYSANSGQCVTFLYKPLNAYR